MRTAIFDLDGTLADTAADLIGAANDLLAESGVLDGRDPPLRADADRNQAGRGGKALIRLGLERAGRSPDAAAVDASFPRYLEIYRARLDRETRLFPGVDAALATLRDDGWRLGVCTNKPERLAVILLERLEVTRYFSAVVGADTLPVRKPDPRPLWETIDRIGGARDRAVMVGDSQTDLDAARAAETAIILTRFGYSLTPVASLKPDVVIDGYNELIPALERLAPK